MSVLADGSTLGAVGAEGERAVQARFLADPDTTLNFGKNGAAN